MRIRFQADANLDPDIGRGLVRREPGVDWRPAQGVIADATSDPDVLQLAANDRRVLISGDVTTLARHFSAFTSACASPGVILISPGTPIGETIERLLIAWLTWSAEDVENQIWWL